MANWNPRQLHRLLVPVAAAPLILTALTGSIYGALDARDVEVEWLLQLHQGEFGRISLQPYYSVLLGACTLFITLSGLSLLIRTRKKVNRS